MQFYLIFDSKGFFFPTLKKTKRNYNKQDFKITSSFIQLFIILYFNIVGLCLKNKYLQYKYIKINTTLNKNLLY